MRLRIVQYTHGTSKSWDTTDNCIMCSKAVSRFLIGAHVVRILSPCSARYELSVFVCMDNNLHRALYWNQDTATNPYPRQWLFPGHYFKSLVLTAMLVQYQYNRHYRKLPISISKYHGQIQKSILLRSSYPECNIFFVKLYMIISQKMAPSPYI